MNSIRLFSQNTNYSPNFKGVNLVQVSKKAFKNPGDIFECSEIFEKTISNFAGQNKITKLNIFGANKIDKGFLSYLESPYFTSIRKMLNQINDTGLSNEQLASDAGISLGKTMDPNLHSFFVLTGKNKAIAIKTSDVQKGLPADISTKIMEDISNDPEFAAREGDNLWAAARGARAMSDIIVERATKNTPVEKFYIETLDKIKGIINKFGIK